MYINVLYEKGDTAICNNYVYLAVKTWIDYKTMIIWNAKQLTYIFISSSSSLRQF
jgi:hypothetical protein